MQALCAHTGKHGQQVQETAIGTRDAPPGIPITAPYSPPWELLHPMRGADTLLPCYRHPLLPVSAAHLRRADLLREQGSRSRLTPGTRDGNLLHYPNLPSRRWPPIQNLLDSADEQDGSALAGTRDNQEAVITAYLLPLRCLSAGPRLRLGG